MTLSSEGTEGKERFRSVIVGTRETMEEGHFELMTVKNGEMTGEEYFELMIVKNCAMRAAG